MKRNIHALLGLVGLALVALLCLAQTSSNITPLLNAKLQSALNGNGYPGTNFGGLSVAGLTNSATSPSQVKVTDANNGEASAVVGTGLTLSGSPLTLSASASGGGGTNSGPIWVWTTQNDTYYTNLGINCATPAGCVTNAPLPFRIILTNSILVANPSNMLDGQNFSIEFMEDSVGTRQVYWGTAFDTSNLNQMSWQISTQALTRTFCTFRYNGGTNAAGNPITNWTMLGVSYGN